MASGYKTFGQLSFKNFSNGTWREVAPSIAPANSVKLALNFDSDKKAGALVTRLGTNIIGTQKASGKRCYGLFHFRDSVGTSNKVFAVFPGATTQTIYDLLDGTANLTGDTNNKKTVFLTYLDSCLRLNGTDAPKAYNGTSWITTGGAFDLANFPSGATGAIEWKDKIYAWGFSTSPDSVKYSGTANPSTRTVSWTTGNGELVFEQEDGGGKIVGCAKIPGYLLVFKRRSMHRYDGAQTYPDSLFRRGAVSNEAICVVRGMCFFYDGKSIFATTGMQPKRVSKGVRDFLEAVPSANYDSVYAFSDEDNAYFSIGNVTIEGETFENVVLKYNVDEACWDIRSYAHPVYCVADYISSNEERLIMLGDNNGNVLQMNTGYTDYTTSKTKYPVTFEIVTQKTGFGASNKRKVLDRIVTFSRGMKTANVYTRADSYNPASYELFGKMDDDITDIADKHVEFNEIEFKISGMAGEGACEFYGFDIPAGDIKLLENAKQNG